MFYGQIRQFFFIGLRAEHENGNHALGKDNPADLLLRGMKAKNLMTEILATWLVCLA